MKKNTLISIVMALAIWMVASVAHAQKIDENTGLVVWEGTDITTAVSNSQKGQFVYLVEFEPTLNESNKEKYLAAGSAYGVQGVMSSVGMRIQIVNSPNHYAGNPYTSHYQIIDRIENSASSTRPWLGDRIAYDQSSVRTNNPSNSASGVPVYLDRGTSYIDGTKYENYARYNSPDWNFVRQDGTVKRNIKYKGEAEKDVNIITYVIQSDYSYSRNGRTYYFYIAENSSEKLVLTTNINNAKKWVIVSEDDYNKAMQQVTWGEVDLGVFVQDAEFGRDNKDATYWKWGDKDLNIYEDQDDSYSNSDHWHQRNQDKMCNGIVFNNNTRITRNQIGTNVATGGPYDHDGFRSNFADYYCAEINNEEGSLTQVLQGSSIPNLIDGLYKLTAQALYYDNEDGRTNNGVSYFVIKREVLDDNGNITDRSVEYMPIEPINQSGASGITTKSGVSAGYVFDRDANKYLLTAFVEISGKVNITIGIQQRVARGWTVIGNVHLYAHGKQALYVDEDWNEEVTLTYKKGERTIHETGNPYTMARWHDNYDYPSTVYYQRTFKVGGWNTICMPLSLTGRQVRQAFGADAKVCAFKGQAANRPSMIYFERPLDLDDAKNMDEYIIEAGNPYIIYVSNDPQHTTAFEAEVGNGRENHTMTIDGAAYSIPGVIKSQYAYMELENGKYVLKDPQVTEGNGGFKMVGSFYHTVIDRNDINCEVDGEVKKAGINDYWVITKGNMYHLTGAKDWNIWATYAYIYLPKGSVSHAKDFSFAIDEGNGIEGITTYIDGLFVESEGNNVEDHDVYTLSGTKVGKGTLDTLPKGIYILNGRKYVKK